MRGHNRVAARYLVGEQTVVSIDSRSRVYVNAIPATRGELVPLVQKALEDKKENLVYVKGDKDAKYSAIMDVMDALRKAQIENIGLITDHNQDQSQKPHR